MNTEFDDPTAYHLGGDPALSDPRQRRLDSWANFGPGFRLQMPYMTQVVDGLWHGGAGRQMILPTFVDYHLAMYQGQEYHVLHELRESRTVKMFDSEDQPLDGVLELAEWVNERRADGTVFVTCQAGLNRSSLVVGAALVLAGDVADGAEAIELMRARRDPAVLCNPVFEAWVRALDGRAHPE